MSKRTIQLSGAVLLLVLASAALTSAGPLSRHVAEYRFGSEQVSWITAGPNGTGGNLVYTKTFTLPPAERTLFITISTTGDSHQGVAHWFSASVNGAICPTLPGDGGAGQAPTGWFPLQKHFDYQKITYTTNGVGGLTGGDGGGGTGDMHDNGIYYTWCCVTGVKPGGPNKVDIRMATSHAGDPVFIERSHYYVDSVRERDLCGAAAPIKPEPGMPSAIREKLLKQQPSQAQEPPTAKPPS